MNIVGENVRRIRESRGFSQEYMAAKMEISQSVYCKIESGKQKLPVQRLMKLSKILDVESENLLASNGEIRLCNCQNSQAINTINGNPAFNNELKEKLIDHLEHENERLGEQNNALIEMLKKYLT